MTRLRQPGPLRSPTVIAVTLPEWLDTDNLRTVALIAVVALIVVAYFVMKVVTAIVVRSIMLAIIVGIGAMVWSQRAALGTCVEDAQQGDCECVIAGFTVPLTARVQEICDARAASVG